MVRCASDLPERFCGMTRDDPESSPFPSLAAVARRPVTDGSRDADKVPLLPPEERYPHLKLGRRPPRSMRRIGYVG
jgi:hypothetical protein